VLKAGEEVTVLAGVNVIRAPDRALAKYDGQVLAKDVSDVSLKRGDVFLIHEFRADGDYDFWAKGVWYTESHEDVSGKGRYMRFHRQ
jgi:hypothetical protein